MHQQSEACKRERSRYLQRNKHAATTGAALRLRESAAVSCSVVESLQHNRSSVIIECQPLQVLLGRPQRCTTPSAPSSALGGAALIGGEKSFGPVVLF